MLLSRQEDSTPVPGHVSIDNCNESSTSPVTLDSLSLSAKRHLFRDDADKTPCRIVSPGNESLDEELEAFIEHKHEEIQKCLNGELSISSPSKSGVDAKENDTVVDLWHLRQLALSKGGLLNASLRKQAWLKLVDANESILMKAITSDAITGETNPTEVLSKDIVKLSDHEINLIEEDINNCIWNLEEEISRHKSSEPNTNQGIIDEDCTNDTASAASYESASESYNGEPTPTTSSWSHQECKAKEGRASSFIEHYYIDSEDKPCRCQRPWARKAVLLPRNAQCCSTSVDHIGIALAHFFGTSAFINVSHERFHISYIRQYSVCHPIDIFAPS
jgi:hypothetical protein